MASKGDKGFRRDQTTGHAWDGITEYDNPLPKWWLYVLYASIAWSVGYAVLYPAIPSLSSHTPGVLGWTQREELSQRVETAQAGQAQFRERIRAASVHQVRTEPDLLGFAQVGGRAAFADNCAPCHAPGGAGRPGYPSLADDTWLWGGTLDDIETTIRQGVRSTAADTRVSQMPAFGADGLLDPSQIAAVSHYVLSLSGSDDQPAQAVAGAAIYADNCVACHGEKGEGVAEVGGPRLADKIWTYGGKLDDIARQVTAPRHGVMPAWEGRLDDVTIKMLTVYVHSLGGGQ